MAKRDLFKIDFCKIVKFDCKCGRRYINTSNCRQCTDSYEKQTNADRIRSMSDAELAEFLIAVESTGYNDDSITPKGKDGYNMDMLEWLQLEVEDIK